MTIGINEVAEAANVSTASVSRALRDLPGVSKQTKQHIMQIAKDLGYMPSHSAVTLASGRTHTVGLVMPDISRWFFSVALEGAENTLRDSGYDALLYSLPDSHGPRHPFDVNVLRGRVDAVIVASIFFNEQEIEQLQSLNMPVVFISVPQLGFPHVGIDDEEAAEKACAHLIDLGHTVIGHLSGMGTDSNANKPTQRRRNGWRVSLVNAGLDNSSDLEVAPRRMTAQEGYRTTRELLTRRPDVTGIFAGSDELAMGSLHALREMGLEAGRDISVIGIDNHDLSSAFGLSTVMQPVKEEGSTAARLALEMLMGKEPQTDSVVFSTTLIQRASTGPAPNNRP